MSRIELGNNAFIVEKVSQAGGFPAEMPCCVRHSRDQLVWISWDLGYRAGIARGMQGKRSVNERMQHG